MYDRWRGWQAVPPPTIGTGSGDWIDLSHRLHHDLSRVGFLPEARFERIMSLAADHLNVTEIHMVCHFGTHVDAPCHFIADGPSFDQIPLDRLYGPGVVWRLRCEPYGLIEPEMFDQAGPPARPGDIVLLDSGSAEHIGTPRYDQHPSLSLAAAEWLVEHQVKLIGVDFATPDLAVNRREPGFRWPVHHILLSHGVLIGEHLTNLRQLGRGRVEVMFLGLNIEGADGAPARVIARPADG